MSPYLPDEIWLEILSYVSDNDDERWQRFFALACCSKQLRRLCRPKMWQYIKIELGTPLNPDRVYRLISMIYRQREIVSYIEHLHLTYSGHGRDPTFTPAKDWQRDDLSAAVDRTPGISPEWRDAAMSGSSAALLSLTIQLSECKTLTLDAGVCYMDIWKFWSASKPWLLNVPQRIDATAVGRFGLPKEIYGTKFLACDLEEYHPSRTLLRQLNSASETLEELVLGAARDYWLLEQRSLDLSGFERLIYLQIDATWLMGGTHQSFWTSALLLDSICTKLPHQLRTLRLVSHTTGPDVKFDLVERAISQFLDKPVETRSITSTLSILELLLYLYDDYPHHRASPLMEKAACRNPPVDITLINVDRHRITPIRLGKRIEDFFPVCHSTALWRAGRHHGVVNSDLGDESDEGDEVSEESTGGESSDGSPQGSPDGSSDEGTTFGRTLTGDPDSSDED
jgi:hypothetical protein